MNIFIRIINRIRFRRIIKGDESANVVDSIVKARKLYKELSLAVHPDRHPDRRETAENLMRRVTANRHNYSELLKLKTEIEESL